MFQQLFANFTVDTPNGPGAGWEHDNAPAEGFADLTSRAAGARFDHGVYRLHTSQTAKQAQTLVAAAYPDYAQRAFCFGYDWLGRQFALDPSRSQGLDPLILLFEPGTGEVLEVPETFRSFHEDLTSYRDVLASDAFGEWIASSPDLAALPMDQCIGYKVPLFLGGEDGSVNFELIDIDVYWTICGQLIRGTRSMPAGTTISQLTIS